MWKEERRKKEKEKYSELKSSFIFFNSKLSKKEIFNYLFFYILTTISWIFSCFIEDNASWILSKNRNVGGGLLLKIKIPFFKKNLVEWNFKGKNEWWFYIFWSFILVLFYSIIVNIHIFFGEYLGKELMISLKKEIMNKYFKIKENNKENLEEVTTLINNDARKFSEYHYFAPNQIYYLILDTLYVLIEKNKGKGGNITMPIIYFFSNIIICALLNVYSYKRELIQQKKNEEQTTEEIKIINNKYLIIKKDKEEDVVRKYHYNLESLRSLLNSKLIIDTAQYAIPSYLTTKYVNFLFSDEKNIKHNEKGGFDLSGFYWYFIKLIGSTKKLVERLKNYPRYFSSRKRIRQFLMKEERDDKNGGFIIEEKIEKIEIKNLNFSYENNKKVFFNFNIEFSKGKINILNGKNGFGKSTLVDIIFGLIKKESGEILINSKFKLDDINLKNWRKKISYAENNNLLSEENLSTGQKQFIDFTETINDKNKEILIFDEADSALDSTKRKIFLDKLEDLSKYYLVILITHK